MSDEVLLSVKGLKKNFGNLAVLKGVDLDVHKGEKIVIIGASGCGKSTFLRCINCLEDPSDGQIMFEGENLADMSVDINIHRQKIGMVFQQFNLFNNYTILDNIMLVPLTVAKKNIKNRKLLGEKKIEIEGKAHSLLKRIGLDDKALCYPSVLSGGQKQRIAIARALIRNPQILILDEATSALDNVSEYHVQKAIESSIKGRTTFIVAHRLSTIRSADRIVCMDKGEIAETGTYEELMALKGKFYELKKLSEFNAENKETE